MKHREALRKEVETDVELLAQHLTSDQQRAMVTAISERIHKDLKEIRILNHKIESLCVAQEISQEVYDNHSWTRVIESMIINLGGLRRSRQKLLSRWFAKHGPLFATAFAGALDAPSSQSVQCTCQTRSSQQ